MLTQTLRLNDPTHPNAHNEVTRALTSPHYLCSLRLANGNLQPPPALRAFATRLIYDKLLHGRNRGKIGRTIGCNLVELSFCQSCPYCNHPFEDAVHWILQCPATTAIRRHYQRQYLHSLSKLPQPLFRTVQRLFEDSISAHHIWIGTWTPFLLSELQQHYVPAEAPIIRRELLLAGTTLTTGLIDMHRHRLLLSPTPHFITTLTTLPRTHVCFPPNLLSHSSRRTSSVTSRPRQLFPPTSHSLPLPSLPPTLPLARAGIG